MMRFTVARAARRAACRSERIHVSMERNMQCGVGHCGHCQLGPALICRDGPVFPLRRDGAPDGGAGAVSARREAEARRLEVLVLRRLPADAARLRGRAARARGRGRDRVLPGGDERRARRARTTSRSSRARSRPRTTPSGSTRSAQQSELLVTIGACATAGGIQALRNFADVKEWIPLVYASPEYISTLATSTPIADHVEVDLELRGCPISKAAARRDGARAPERPPAAACRRRASASSARRAARRA